MDADEYARLVDGPNRNGEGVEAATGLHRAITYRFSPVLTRLSLVNGYEAGPVASINVTCAPHTVDASIEAAIRDLGAAHAWRTYR